MTNSPISPEDRLLTPAEVSALFRVDPRTVTRWAKAGKLTSIRTLGGHRRFSEAEVQQLLAPVNELPQSPGQDPAASDSVDESGDEQVPAAP